MQQKTAVHVHKPSAPIDMFKLFSVSFFLAYLLWRLYVVLIAHPAYGPDTWLRFSIDGVVLGVCTP